MVTKLIRSIMVLVILFVLLSIFKGNAAAMSAPYLSLDCEKDIVTDHNAILNAKLSNVEGKRIKAFEIRILCGNTEVSRYQKAVNDSSERISVSFDLEKETGIRLESNRRYDYIISAITEEHVNASMYTARHHFTTQCVKVTAVTDKVRTDTALLKVNVINPNRQYIQKISVKVFQGSKLVKEYNRTVNKTEQGFSLSFDMKKDFACTLKPNTQYTYTVYAEVDVSQSYLYQAIVVYNGKVKTSQKTGVKANASKSRKIITLKNVISNPYAKKVSEIKVVAKSGNKQQVIFKKKIARRRQYLKRQTYKIYQNRAKLKKKLKAKKYTFIIYVRIGGKLYKAKVRV